MLLPCSLSFLLLNFAAAEQHGSCPSFLDQIILWNNGRRFNACEAVSLKRFQDWTLSNSLLSSGLPVEPERQNFVRQVRNATFSVVKPTAMRTRTRLVALSEDVLTRILDLDPTDCWRSKQFLNFVAGNNILKGSSPMAHRYGGHQFGWWAGQLGDGRAHLLGDYLNRHHERWELQLKGAGKTPYSRHGDGRAVLRSSVREFLCSEALHHLGIPTSRAVSLVVSDDQVIRDQFYNGDARSERAAVVLRVAQSWFRFGSLEILESASEIHLLHHLVDYIIENYFKSMTFAPGNKYVQFYQAVFDRTISTIVKWMAFGFAHGVCNTDNFSILGITIDFGPFGFVEEYDPNFVPNTSDDGGRYRLKNQPAVAKFNLNKLRIALHPLVEKLERKKMKGILNNFDNMYQKLISDEFREKLGFFEENSNVLAIISSLLRLMEETKSDFTMTFRELSELTIEKFHQIPKSLWALNILSVHDDFQKWISSYRDECSNQNVTEAERMRKMQAKNPRYVLKNWMAERAIRYANRNDFSHVRILLKILQNPFTKQDDAEEAGYGNPRPFWADDLKVSCSS